MTALATRTSYGASFAGIGIGYAVVCMLTAALILWKSTLQPIRAHHPWVLALQATVMSAFGLYLCLKVSSDDNSISCILVQVFDTVGYVITPQIYLIRTLRLLVVHTNTAYMIARAQAAASDDNSAIVERDALSFRIRRISPTNMVYYSIGLLLVLFLVAVVTAPAGYENSGNGCGYTVDSWVLVAYLGLAFISMLVLGFMIRNVDDSFHIVVELRWVSLLLFILTVAWAVCLLVPDIKIAIGDFPLTATMVMVALNCCWALSLLMPLAVSLLYPIVKLTGDEMQSLPGLLTTPAGYDSFHDFLKLEFSIENLYFWSEVNLYRQHAERLLLSSDEDEVGDEAVAELLEVARGIYMDFIDNSTAHQVNLSAPVVANIRRVLADFASIPSKIPGPWNARMSKSRSAASANELASISLTEFAPKSDAATEEDVASAQPASSMMHSSSASTSASSSTTPHPFSTYQKSPTLSPSDIASESPAPALSKRASLTPTTAVAVVAASAEHERSRSFTTVVHARSSPEFARLCCIYNSAQTSTLDLMTRDSYARYLCSPQHAAIVEAWKRNSVIGGLRRARSLYGGMHSPDQAAALAAMRSGHGAEMTAMSL